MMCNVGTEEEIIPVTVLPIGTGRVEVLGPTQIPNSPSFSIKIVDTEEDCPDRIGITIEKKEGSPARYGDVVLIFRDKKAALPFVNYLVELVNKIENEETTK